MRAWLAVLLVSCHKPPAAPAPEKAAPVVVAPRPLPCPVAPRDPAEDLPIPEPNRALTAGERALLQPIFRNAIDYDKVRVIDNSFPFQPEGVYMTPRGNVYAPGSLYREDFAHSPDDRSVFVHEMGHVWQFGNGMDLIGQGIVEFTSTRGNYQDAYPYTLDDKLDLTDYGMEQQASIIEDYFIIHVLGEAPRFLKNRVTEAVRDQLYAAVLKKFLADACYLRPKATAPAASRP
ncbi:MAG: hypothetical protein KF773_26215 [Deltaproteobacteria bacterium]|nr:hypothetical protein [Deltaproteobacteria bacterium]